MDWTAEIELIRFTLALTEDSAGLVTDDEIIRLLEQYPTDWRLAAAALADALASRAINSPSSFSVPGRISVDWGSRAKMWQEQAKSLRKQVADDDADAATAGTISITTMEAAGFSFEEPEYSRPRKPWSWKE